mmetsp:Transcript_24937/g.36869  ORF Transcript_24937/g.36869 Transcript_24937/m.36869 type:complete len:274 (-) Transcript_24937:923-1744(-)
MLLIGFCCCICCCWPAPPGSCDLGFTTVSSMDRITHAASAAAPSELRLLSEGSQTPDSNVSQILPASMSTPYHVPSSSIACFLLKADKISVASNPALSHNCCGTTSRDLAKAEMISCPFPSIVNAYSFKYLEISISTAPPPATTELDFKHLFTTMRASWIDLSLSAINCSLPPLSTMVLVRFCGHSSNTLKRSSPTCRSSNLPHVPRIPSKRPLVVVWTVPPVALQTRLRSESSTRPAQNKPLSAKYCVARSPTGSLERTMLAPQSTQASSLS